MKLLKKFIIIFIMTGLVTAAKSLPLSLIGYPGQDPDIETLRAALFFPGDENYTFAHNQFLLKNTFYDLGLVYNINIYEERPDLEYKLWIQPKPAPMIVILPGTGSFYSSSKIIALAELFYLKGYSILAISDVFNWQFSESASSVLVPGYSPVDSADLYYVLCKIFKFLDKKYKDKIIDKILVGFSLGGQHALFIADLESKLKGNKIGFSRYLALNPPVDLLYSVKTIDTYYAIGSSLTKNQISEGVSKGLKLYQQIIDKKLDQSSPINLNKDEARYVIGLDFHMTLVELLYSINSRNKLSVFSQDYTWFSKEDLYKEINKFSFYAYLTLILKPYYEKELNQAITIEELNKASSLTRIENTLKNNDKIRVIHTTNDFLLDETQRKWLEDTMGNKLTLLDHGGHCGYLYFKQAASIIYQKVDPKNKK